MPIIKKNGVEIYYEEAGTGFPLLVLPGGGLNATVAGLKDHAFNPISEFSNKYRVIALDHCNANDGKTIEPLEIKKPRIALQRTNSSLWTIWAWRSLWC